MFPIIIAAGILALVGFKYGQLKDRPYVTSGAGTGPNLLPKSTGAATNPTQALTMLGNMTQRRQFPQGAQGDRLLISAYREAVALKAQDLMAWVAGIYAQKQQADAANGYQAAQQAAQPAPEESVTAGGEPEFDGTAESWGEFANPAASQPAAPQPVATPAAQPVRVAPGQAARPSGGFWDQFPSTNWDEFMGRLATQSPDFRSENYLGKYEHNRRRMRQLGIQEPRDEQEQQAAILRDLGDHYEKCQSIISKYTGQPVDLGDGVPVQVTTSGVLGLLKAAGPRGAEGWLSNPKERSAHPVTTQIFTRTNGCF